MRSHLASNSTATPFPKCKALPTGVRRVDGVATNIIILFGQ